MAAGGLGTLALGTAALFDLGPFAPAEPDGLVVDDPSGDCREAGLDRGESCARGADIEAISLRTLDGDTLMVELRLDDTPDLGPAVAWTVEFYVDAANAFTEGGIICRLSNVEDGDGPGPEPVSRALDPNTVPRQPVDARACDGRLDGTAARFSVNVNGQPTDEPFRVIGLVRLEYPDDSGRLGSEDDFLVGASLADLRR